MLIRTQTASILNETTPLLITFNEEANLERTLAKLTWARRIVIVDSGSTDRTLEILSAYPEVDVYFNEFNNFASQCEFGLSRIKTEWVLSLDADYELSDGLVSELESLEDDGKTTGYRAKFVYRIYGRSLRGTLYPPRAVLYRRNRARYRVEAHGHRVEIDGLVQDLMGVIYHDDRKPLGRWFASQQRYAALESRHLLSAERTELSRVDRIRLMAWPAPILVFLYVLFAKRCILDGWPGVFYALQRLLAETMLSLELIDRRYLRSNPDE